MMKRTTVVLSDHVHEELRAEAFRNRVSMAQLIRDRLERPASKRKKRRGRDPLLAVSGIGADGKLAVGIDKALYGT